jgi:7-cyano-7-deazaguanine synthase
MSDLLLLSGGIDSIALAAWLRPAECLTINYGQRPAAAEFSASAAVCQDLKLPHKLIDVPLDGIGSGLMAGLASATASPHPEFWPFRNQLLTTLASMYAIRAGHSRVLIGTVVTDRRHVDGSPAFLETLANLVVMQEGAIQIVAPALNMNTTELINRSGVANRTLGWAHSCHRGNIACGDCPGCTKHSMTMQALGWNR